MSHGHWVVLSCVTMATDAVGVAAVVDGGGGSGVAYAAIACRGIVVAAFTACVASFT